LAGNKEHIAAFDCLRVGADGSRCLISVYWCNSHVFLHDGGLNP